MIFQLCLEKPIFSTRFKLKTMKNVLFCSHTVFKSPVICCAVFQQVNKGVKNEVWKIIVFNYKALYNSYDKNIHKVFQGNFVRVIIVFITYPAPVFGEMIASIL